MLTPSRRVNVTRSRLAPVGARVVPPLQRWSRAARCALQKAARWLLHRWRASLQLRVMVSTMLLGVIVARVLGSCLYQGIGDGLVSDRILTAQAEATFQTRAAQSRFGSAGRLDV